MPQKTYDIIILGAGCAGLSLLLRLTETPFFTEKKILLIDQAPKIQNDRTWCFWEAGAGFFEPVVIRNWERVIFRSKDFNGVLNMQPYRYKMIRGIDFYNHCYRLISQYSNIDIIYDEVIATDSDSIHLKTQSINRHSGSLVFSSLRQEIPQQKHKHYLLQHFKGWLIETDQPHFDQSCATLMDFTISQEYGTGFVYVMPLTDHKALIEFTLFTESLLKPAQYEASLRTYIHEHLKITDYRLVEEEFGVIPMTNAHFPRQKDGIYFIGTAGGQTKASTGYTFQFIQKQTAAIVKNLQNGSPPFAGIPAGRNRFALYDSTLLHVLSAGKIPGDELFARLFKRNKASRLFRFLDNDSSFAEELGIMWSVPQGIFLKAAFAELLSKK